MVDRTHGTKSRIVVHISLVNTTIVYNINLLVNPGSAMPAACGEEKFSPVEDVIHMCKSLYGPHRKLDDSNRSTVFLVIHRFNKAFCNKLPFRR